MCSAGGKLRNKKLLEALTVNKSYNKSYCTHTHLNNFKTAYTGMHQK